MIIMSNIIRFPVKSHRSSSRNNISDLERLKSNIHAELLARGEDDELIQRVLQRTQTLYKKYHDLGHYQFTITFPKHLASADAENIVSQVSDGIQKINSLTEQAVTQLVSRIINLEIELYKKQRHDGE